VHYLITGGAGFIGSHLAESLLQERHEVTILDDFNDFYAPSLKRANAAALQENATIIEGDFCDNGLISSMFNEKCFDCVVHLGARAGVRSSIKNPSLYLRTNLDGTHNLLAACEKHNVPDMVFASSSSVYGVNSSLPFREDNITEGVVSPYAASKAAAEQLCSSYAYLHGIRIRCLRLFTVYGPRQRPDLAIAKFVDSIRRGLPIEQYGDGSSARDYTYIDDIIEGIRSAISFKPAPFEIINLGGSQSTKLIELIKIIEEELATKADITIKPESQGDILVTLADISKAADLLGYHPVTNLREGIRKYIRWITSEEY